MARGRSETLAVTTINIYQSFAEWRSRGPNSDLVFIVVKLKEFQPRDLKQSPCHPATFKQMIRLEGWHNEEAGEACFCLDVIQRVTPCSIM